MSRPNKSADKIVDAFIDLITRKTYSSISIADITTAADVSRICFYRNFDSKEQVLDRYMSRVAKDLQDKMSLSTELSSLQDYFAFLFSSLGKLSPIIHEIYNANLGCLILDHFNEKLFTTALTKLGITLSTYERRFYTGAFYNVLIDWIMNGMHESVEKISMICCQLTH